MQYLGLRLKAAATQKLASGYKVVVEDKTVCIFTVIVKSMVAIWLEANNLVALDVKLSGKTKVMW